MVWHAPKLPTPGSLTGSDLLEFRDQHRGQDSFDTIIVIVLGRQEETNENGSKINDIVLSMTPGCILAGDMEWPIFGFLTPLNDIPDVFLREKQFWGKNVRV